ncbi:MAG: 4-hydroxythreonine-4-phosphate dehydrogenase PdxA [Hyphomicrobiaceae bacterium]
METELSAPLALTMGDPAGIGLDITLAAWATRAANPLPPFVLLADAASVSARAARLGLACEICAFDNMPAVEALPRDRLAILAVPLAVPVAPGVADPRNAGGVIASIERAVDETCAGRAAGIVTNPISKATVYAAGFAHPGHTEFLGALAELHVPGRRWTPVMMLASDALRVVPLTVHISLAGVPRQITQQRIVEVCRITAEDLAKRFGLAHPRIAVAGLNPHAGEGGSLGREEIEIIAPAIETLRSGGLDVSGPHSADTLFHAAARARYDVAVCMYHDQALIPIKTLAFDTGVNVTLGLPFIRTSPDHGTAFDIAGSGKASPNSLIAALRMAAHMAAHSAPVSP